MSGLPGLVVGNITSAATNATNSTLYTGAGPTLPSSVGGSGSTSGAFAYWPIGVFILVAFVAYLLYRYFTTRPKVRKIKSTAKIVEEQMLADTSKGGYKPSNAIWQDGKDLYKVYWYDPAYLAKEIEVPTEAPPVAQTGIPKSKQKLKPVPVKQMAPLKCWYMRVRPVNTFLQRLFPSFVPFEFYKAAAHKFDQPEYDSKGELAYLTSKEVIYWKALGRTHVDREYEAQLRESNLDAGYYGPVFYGILGRFADAALKQDVIDMPPTKNNINRIRAQGEADESVENVKHPGTEY